MLERLSQDQNPRSPVSGEPIPARCREVEAFGGEVAPGAFVSFDPGRFALRLFHDPADNHILGWCRFGEGTEDATGGVHLGAQVALIDELMGGLCWMSGMPVLAARLQPCREEPLQAGAPVDLRVWIDRVDGRKVHTNGELVDGRGRTVFRCPGLFVQLRSEHMQAFAEQVSGR